MELQGAYTALMTEIAGIDEKLDSLTDVKAAGKRTKINEFIKNTEGSWQKVVEDFTSQLSNAPDEVKIGIYFGITRGLDSAFRVQVNETLDKIIESMPPAAPLISVEEAPGLSKVRTDLYSKVKAVINLAEQFGEDASMVMPRKRTGSKGPRGKRALSFFSWFVDATPYSKLSDVVADYDQYDKVSNLTAAMREAELDLRNPPDRIEFTLPDGKTLIGLNGNVDEDVEDEEEEDDSEEE